MSLGVHTWCPAFEPAFPNTRSLNARAYPNRMDQPSKGSADPLWVKRFLEVPPPDAGGGERWATHQENLEKVARSLIQVEQSLANLRELIRSPATTPRFTEFAAAAATRAGAQPPPPDAPAGAQPPPGPFSPRAAKRGWRRHMQPEEETVPPSDAPPPTQDHGREFVQGEREDYMGRQEASFEGEVLLGSVLVTGDSSSPSKGRRDGTSLTRRTSQRSDNQPGDK